MYLSLHTTAHRIIVNKPGSQCKRNTLCLKKQVKVTLISGRNQTATGMFWSKILQINKCLFTKMYRNITWTCCLTRIEYGRRTAFFKVFFISKSDKLFPHFQDHSAACVHHEIEDRL